ncbi:MAG TPA: nicotinamide mononucleotide transporter [Gammaproteobacteria bacterium]|nr:nicotinamide mononucleotide transporter [Gammaproteobacteria bacterium]
MTNINWIAEIFDTIFSLSGQYGRWLNARGYKISFIVWTICTIYWAIRDFRLGLYSQSIFCVFSIAVNIYGYFNWKAMRISPDQNKKIIIQKNEAIQSSLNAANAAPQSSGNTE